MENAIVISINGQKAVDVARAFCAGCCTRGIYAHGKRIAQLEVVVDQDGTYNGNPNKWVDVTVIAPGKAVLYDYLTNSRYTRLVLAYPAR